MPNRTLLRVVDANQWGGTLASAALLIIVKMAGIGPVSGQARESWEIQLRAQLEQQQRCSLADFVTQREVPLAGQLRREGRIRCADGREFDYTRERESERFTIRLCQPVVC